MPERWKEAPRQTGNEELARRFGISPMTVRLIRSRGADSEEEIRRYLYGTLEDLCAPSLMKGIPEAVVLIEQKIKHKTPMMAESRSLPIRKPLNMRSA